MININVRSKSGIELLYTNIPVDKCNEVFWISETKIDDFYH